MGNMEKTFATMFVLGFFLAIPAAAFSEAAAGVFILFGLLGGVFLALSAIWG